MRHLVLRILFNDGENYILVNTQRGLEAYNFNGVLANNFPFTDSKNSGQFNSFISPLTLDYNNDGNVDILTFSSTGSIYIFEAKSGKLHSGFPIAVETALAVSPTISKSNFTQGNANNVFLTVVSDKNSIYQWSLSNIGEIYWSSKFRDEQNTSYIKSAATNNFVSTFFPKNKTYNWPNPVYGNETHFRTYVAEDSKVKIKVFDLVGDLVGELEFNAIGGLDSEILWDVSNIQSGAYFAHLEVTSNSGKTDSKIIKIAIVK